MIHRDIKPANIWLEGNPSSFFHGEQVRRCVLLDFGIVHLLDPDGKTLTATGAILGTPSYMSPEQAVDEDTLDGRVDIWSLGMVLYHMTTGQVPFKRSKPMQTISALIKATEPPQRVRELNPAVPQELCDLIRGMLIIDRTRRIQMATEIRAMTETLSAKLPR
jgi:serine/threonine-protein kinase